MLEVCIRRRGLVAVLAVLLLVFGWYSWKTLRLEAYPELGGVEVTVTTQVPGLAAEVIEQEITTPLERQLSGTPNLTSMRSSSTFGLSLIKVMFSDGTDFYFARQRVLERIAAANLPSQYQPSLDPMTGPSGEVYRYTLQSDRQNLMQLSEIQRWVVVPALEAVHGIANVDTFGGFTKEFRLDLDPAKLQSYGLALNDVTAAINANTADAGGSRLTRGEQDYVIRGQGLVHDLDDMGRITVATRNGVGITVADLGTLSYSHQEREGILGRNNNPDTVEGVVQALRGENASAVLVGVHHEVDVLNDKLGKQGVRIVPYIDRDQLVQSTVSKVAHTVAEGIVLVFIVLIAFLGSPRSALVVAVTIPMALVAVFGLMNLFGMPANLFSLGAIDFGVIVDGAIVVTESLLRRREEHPEAELSEDDVRVSAAAVARPIFFATLIIMTAYAPLLSFEHAEARLFAPMALTVCFALAGALVCTLLLVPGLGYWAFRRPSRPFHNPVLEALESGYHRALAGLLRVPMLAVGASLAVLVCVVGLGMTIGREFLPDLDEGALWLQVQMPSGISLDKASDMAADLRRAIRSFPEVSFVVTQVGRSDDGTDPWTPSHIEAPVGLTPYSTWPDGETKAQFVARLAAKLHNLPGYDIGISQPIADNLNDETGGAHSPLAILVYGNDFHQLRDIAGQIVDVLHQTKGTSEASIFQEPPIPQLVIRVDRAAAARYGINVADIMTLINTGIGGAPLTQVYVGDRQYNVTVRFNAKARATAQSIGALTLNAPNGAPVKLAQLANISFATGESTISHQNGQRDLIVRADLRGRDLASYLDEIQHSIEAKVHYDHDNYRIAYAGQFENQRRAQARLTIVMGIIMVVMLGLLFVGLGNFRHALLTLGIVPLATLGGLVALHVTGETLNVATAVGFIALFGVAVQNGIIMVSHLNAMRAEGLSLREAVLRGAADRFRPVLMTATVASLGMLPAALAHGVGTDVQRGLATVVVGGLAVATLLTLFILPALYFLLERGVERRQMRRRPAGAA
nr:CusA/CzcA family heavy metal efflux RND transporter [Endobacter medicaginis]